MMGRFRISTELSSMLQPAFQRGNAALLVSWGHDSIADHRTTFSQVPYAQQRTFCPRKMAGLMRPNASTGHRRFGPKSLYLIAVY